MSEEIDRVEISAKVNNFDFTADLDIKIQLPEDALLADVNSVMTKIIAQAQSVVNELYPSEPNNT